VHEIVQWAARQDEMKIAHEIYIPKNLKDTGELEKQMRSKHHKREKSERKDDRRRRVLGSVGGRSVGGRGR